MNNKAIIALAMLIGCAETETSTTPDQTETENTTTEATNSETTENTNSNTKENTSDITEKTKTTSGSGESAVSSD